MVIENFIAAETETLPDWKEKGRDETKGRKTAKSSGILQTGNSERATQRRNGSEGRDPGKDGVQRAELQTQRAQLQET